MNNAGYVIICQSVLSSPALSSLLIVTIIFILKLEHTGFQKALLYIINVFNSIKKLEIIKFLFKFKDFFLSLKTILCIYFTNSILESAACPNAEEGPWKRNRPL